MDRRGTTACRQRSVVNKLLSVVAVGTHVSRLKTFIQQLYRYETDLLEDLAVSLLLFVGISAAWAYAPEAWPQVIYYAVLAVALFGYFKFVSPPPNERKNDTDD